LPGIPDLLEALSCQSSLLMGLGTGNLEEGARVKLARADLMKYFHFGGYGSDSEDRPTVLPGALAARRLTPPRTQVGPQEPAVWQVARASHAATMEGLASSPSLDNARRIRTALFMLQQHAVA